MAVNQNNTITAAQFNNLQSRISQVVGLGSGDFGYGQAVQSTQVSALTDESIPDGDSITAEQFNNLRSDLGTAYTHQTGENIPINAFSSGDIIGADQSGSDLEFAPDGSYTFLNADAQKGFNDLLSIMTDIESDRFIIDASQQEIQVRATDDRTTQWNGTINSEFTVSFTDADARRHFFNAGGQIRISGFVDMGTSTGDSQARDQGWKDMIENPGEIQFDYNSTVITGSTTGVSFPAGVVGNEDLNSTYQIIFRKDANSGTYGDSYWKIEAKEDSSSVIRIKVELVDDGPESDSDAGDVGSIPGGVTEPVTADLEFEFTCLRANGAVVLPFPSYSITNTFE
jgi:hypothetical protein